MQSKKNIREVIKLHRDGLSCIFAQLRMQTRPKLAPLVIVDGKVAEVQFFAFGSGQELLGRLVLDIHYVEHGGRKSHACRTPCTIEQILAQLINIDFDFHGETSCTVTATA